MSERYEVIRTLIIGKQSAKKTINAKGEVKISHHKLATGYVLKDLTDGSKIAVEHLEAPEYENEYGMVNARTVVSTSQTKSGVRRSPYIKAKAGYTPLQDPSLVVDPHRYLKDNPDVKVTRTLAEALVKKPAKSTGRSSKPRYTQDEIAKIIEEKKRELGRL